MEMIKISGSFLDSNQFEHKHLFFVQLLLIFAQHHKRIFGRREIYYVPSNEYAQKRHEKNEAEAFHHFGENATEFRL